MTTKKHKPEIKKTNELYIDEAVEPIKATIENQAKVRVALNVRKQPSLNAGIAMVLSPDTIVNVISDEGEWLQIDKGFVKSEFVDRI